MRNSEISSDLKIDNTLRVSLEDISFEAVEVCNDGNRSVQIIGGKPKDIINLENSIRKLDKSIKVEYKNIRTEFPKGLDYLNKPYFIELDKIKIIYSSD